MEQLLEQINLLKKNLASIEPYAKNCVKLERFMPCRAFFPGGDGLWNPGRPSKPIRVLFLGSDFNNEENYDAEFKKPESEMRDSPKTWSGLETLIKQVGIAPEECFFTNAWPCLRKGNLRNAGDPPGAKDLEFTSRCRDFLRLTLDVLRPRYVISLGTWPTMFLSGFVPDAMKNWNIAKWSSIDATDRFTLVLNGQQVTFIPAIHPSLPNHRYRLVHKTASAEADHIRNIVAKSEDKF
ncbi:MAG TPA: uracil-DNA glycosylase family protein [Edaphobacter sp.]